MITIGITSFTPLTVHVRTVDSDRSSCELLPERARPLAFDVYIDSGCHGKPIQNVPVHSFPAFKYCCVVWEVRAPLDYLHFGLHNRF